MRQSASSLNQAKRSSGWGRANFCLAHLLERLLRVLHELAHCFPGVTMIHHLGQELWRNRDDVRPSQRRTLDVHDRTDASHEDSRRGFPFIQPVAYVTNHHGGIAAFVAPAPREDTRTWFPGLRSQKGVGPRENRAA